MLFKIALFHSYLYFPPTSYLVYTFRSVSYTHLDVYKRQGENSVMWSCDEGGMPATWPHLSAVFDTPLSYGVYEKICPNHLNFFMSVNFNMPMLIPNNIEITVLMSPSSSFLLLSLNLVAFIKLVLKVRPSYVAFQHPSSLCIGCVCKTLDGLIHALSAHALSTRSYCGKCDWCEQIFSASLKATFRRRPYTSLVTLPKFIFSVRIFCQHIVLSWPNFLAQTEDRYHHDL